MSEQTKFKDEATLQGLYEFSTDTGRLRFEDKGTSNKGHCFSVYEQSGNCFIHVGRVFVRGQVTCEKLYNKYISLD
ncbi:MAG TPA: hypothetical protein VNX01_15230 [Bacteroidia bacterium]|jgi:hypothetical protein|nr:hypothetical protein [Bacteroidia bacterium]